MSRANSFEGKSVREVIEMAAYSAMQMEALRLFEENERLRKAMEAAKNLIGAINDNALPAVRESNVNQAWHILNDNLRVTEV